MYEFILIIACLIFYPAISDGIKLLIIDITTLVCIPIRLFMWLKRMYF